MTPFAAAVATPTVEKSKDNSMKIGIKWGDYGNH